MARTRQNVKPLNKTAEAVATNAAAERARKAASRKALKDAQDQTAKTALILASGAAPLLTTPQENEVNANTEAPVAPASKPVDHEAILAAMLVDYEAERDAGNIEEGTTFKAYLADQGFMPDGTTIPAPTGYTGPMLALVAARKAYVKAPNGILCNGDNLAALCGHYERPVVVAALIKALNLPGNPYTQLNPGQQSMNLRNKARHALKNGTVTMAAIEAALAAVVKV